MHQEADNIFRDIESSIKTKLGLPGQLRPRGQMTRHQINSTLIADIGETACFIKLNRAEKAGMFEAEYEGLEALAQSATVRVPAPVCTGSNESSCWLVLEYLALGGERNPARLGMELAEMHRHTGEQHGWHRDNTIGLTHQANTPDRDWIRFWKERRLGFQLDLARKNGYSGRIQEQGEQLIEDLGALFTAYQPQPSLLHGDLWSGNHGYTAGGVPVIFDPAVYYGDRETDIAMTELFGGYEPEFYAAYDSHYPLDDGYRVRKWLYQLYHVLNHLNLFGSGYLGQALGRTEKLNAELG